MNLSFFFIYKVFTYDKSSFGFDLFYKFIKYKDYKKNIMVNLDFMDYISKSDMFISN